MHGQKIILIFTVLVIHFYVFHACLKYGFKFEVEKEFKDHVITTMTTPYVEVCWDKCVWINSCFSVNFRKNRFGMFECDLNNSSKKASPGSLVPTLGSQYHQMKKVGCGKHGAKECIMKEALEDDWYRFNSAKMKIIFEVKVWNESRAHCLSLGGDLASISSSYESEFLNEVKKIAFKKKGYREQSTWIGLNAINDGEAFVWSDGSPNTFMAYDCASGLTPRKCITLKNGKVWTCETCELKAFFVCEVFLP